MVGVVKKIKERGLVVITLATKVMGFGSTRERSSVQIWPFLKRMLLVYV